MNSNAPDEALEQLISEARSELRAIIAEPARYEFLAGALSAYARATLGVCFLTRACATTEEEFGRITAALHPGERARFAQLRAELKRRVTEMADGL